MRFGLSILESAGRIASEVAKSISKKFVLFLLKHNLKYKET